MTFKPEGFAISTDFKTLVSEEIATIILTCFTYLLIALGKKSLTFHMKLNLHKLPSNTSLTAGVIMLLKLYFQTVFIFAKYFPIITLPFYIIGAWAFSALLFYMAWDLGYGVDDEGNPNTYIMKTTYAAIMHQGLVVG